jgi:hypothetical protein
MPRKALPRLRTVTSGVDPSAAGGRRLRTFKSADDAKKFYAAVQDETSSLALYRLEEEARRYVHGEAPKRMKPKTISIP